MHIHHPQIKLYQQMIKKIDLKYECVHVDNILKQKWIIINRWWFWAEVMVWTSEFSFEKHGFIPSKYTSPGKYCFLCNPDDISGRVSNAERKFSSSVLLPTATMCIQRSCFRSKTECTDTAAPLLLLTLASRQAALKMTPPAMPPAALMMQCIKHKLIKL